MRFPIASSIESRDGSLSKDAKLVNCFVDVEGETSFVVKRPGLRKSVASASGTGLGMVSWEGNMYHAVGSTFYQTAYASIPSGSGGGASASYSTVATFADLAQSTLAKKGSSLFFVDQAYDSMLYTSTDGAAWSVISSNTSGYFGACPASDVWANGTYLYGWDGSNAWQSTDGVTWSNIGTLNSASFSANVNDVTIWDGTRFVNFKSGVWVKTSTNFTTWTSTGAASPPVTNGGVVMFGSDYLAMSYFGVMSKSADLASWSVQSITGYANEGGRTFIKATATKLYVVELLSASSTIKVYEVNASFVASLIHSGSYSGPYFNDRMNYSQYIGDDVFSITGGSGGVGPSYIQKLSATGSSSYATPPYSYAFTTATPGLPLSWVGTSPGTYTKKMFIKNEEKAWTLTLGTPGVLTQVTDPDYPAKTVPGAVYLDGYFFVMDKDGTVYNCDLENPDSWNALNYITAEAEWDKGVAIAKHQNYVVALKDWTCELFYDAANPTGSPLSKVSNATVQIGCAQGYSTVQFHGGLIFMSKTRERGRSVHFFPPNSIDPQEIASASIQRILNAADLTTVRAWGGKLGGRILYVLNLVSANISLVYDFTSHTWAQWTSDNAGTEGYFKYGFYATDGNRDYLLHETTGEVFTLTPDVYQDNGADIKVLIRTGRLDAGNMDRKTMSQLTIVGDKAATSVSVQQSDDDYQTFSTARTVAMDAEPPRLLRLGMFRRRSFDIRHVDNTPLRLTAIDAEIQQAR